MPTYIFVNDWTFSKTLGSGGFGIVQLWTHKTGDKLAIKKCKWDAAQLTERQKERWINEVQIMKRLKHANIVKALELPFKYPDEKIDLPILCMEFCRKGDLRKVLNKAENCCGVSEKEAIVIMKSISSAVEFLHSNSITHRDLKPENIVLQDDNDEISYKLIDLGYAKELGEASSSASLVGTLNYVAPELLWKKKYSCSVDYWSLGILFYELISGTRPFLPRMQDTMTWMRIIQNKGYNDICAYELEGNHVFGQNIVGPTNLSRCLRNKLVDWFRVMLQWDSKTRGKKCDENGEMQLVAFKLLQSILSKQIVYVFSVSTYKIDAYEVNDTTTATELQIMIEEDTNIPVNQQILTNYFGKVLVSNEASLLSEIQDPLFVFKRGSSCTEITPTQDIPMPIQKMIEHSKNSLDFGTLMDYYRVAINFIKQELDLFQLYIFALTIKIDLVITRLNTNIENVKTVSTNTNALLTEVSVVQVKWNEESVNEEKLNCLEQISKKICTVVQATDKIKLMFNPLIKESNDLKTNAQRIDCIGDILQLYNKAMDIYELGKREHPHKNAKPTEMVKLIFNFLTMKEELSRNTNILEIIKQMEEFERKILTMEEIFDSVIVMSTVYRHGFQNVIQSNSNPPAVAQNKVTCISTSNDIKMSNEFHSNQSPNTSTIGGSKITEVDKIISDNIIYENLLMRHRLDNLLSEIQESIKQIINLEL
ncbi:inhibitor of nuclear factor kappa B kinase subunit beta [Lasioglossum baleicum]|uniref:inhibitor of nuclear factor kappa B kinase subunit beta n=1 Tax=Lasioglossum baleicum TaxID=434251 RepID=UPI003FCE74BC